jgi:hypothetical protein
MHNKTAELNGTVETSNDRPFVHIWKNRDELQNETSGQGVQEYLGCGCALSSIKKS